MSDALQKAAGEKMKKILEFLTKNPIMGVLAGALVTAVLQSSSATTVMVIGFVSAGLMSLPQAISVIFSPAAFCSASLILFIPYKNSARPPASPNTTLHTSFITFSSFPMCFLFLYQVNIIREI